MNIENAVAFAPVLKADGGGALLNVLSVASWVNGGELAAYSASKAEAWSLTNALRQCGYLLEEPRRPMCRSR